MTQDEINNLVREALTVYGGWKEAALRGALRTHVEEVFSGNVASQRLAIMVLIALSEVRDADA